MLTSVYNWYYYDRVPNVEEVAEISRLHNELAAVPDERIMIKLHNLCHIGEYQKCGYSWKSIGFQKDDPLSDVRGGGMLCIVNLIYFLEEFSLDALSMCRTRANRDDGANYPWAAASISVTRMVASAFQLVDDKSGKPCNVSLMPMLSYYHLLLEDNGFNKLYVIAFVLLDHQFTATNGSYMTFPTVLSQTKSIFVGVLCTSRTVAGCAGEAVRLVDKKYHPLLQCM